MPELSGVTDGGESWRLGHVAREVVPRRACRRSRDFIDLNLEFEKAKVHIVGFGGMSQCRVHGV